MADHQMGTRLLSFLPLTRVTAIADNRVNTLSFQNTGNACWSNPSALARQRFIADAAPTCLTSENG